MSKKTEQSLRDQSIARKHEQSDVDFIRILIIGFGLLGLMVAGLLYSDLVAVVFEDTSSAPGAPAEVLIDYTADAMPPEPRLEANPNSSLVAYRAWEDSVLSSYGWVDREKGIVSVPVEVGMGRLLDLMNE